MPRISLTIPDDNNLNLAKFNAFADDKFYVTKNINTIFQMTEDIAESEENAGLPVNQHFLLFPQRFQKLSFLESLKLGIISQKV